MFIQKLNSKYVFKYPFDAGKKLSLVECFERNKYALFCLLSYIRFNSYQCFSNQKLALYYKKERKPHKQRLKQHEAARRYSSAPERETFSFQIFCAKNVSANCLLQILELNQTR